MLTEIAGEDTVLKIECFLKKVKKVYWDNRNRKMTETTTLSPLVSIIVPVYNVERYIKRCVDSLQGQTLQNIEIILVDDGSKDNSGRLCDEFAQQNPRIHVIHKQNAGQGLARNDGLNIAKGRYVLFIDSDDFIEPDTCEKLSDRMEQEGARSVQLRLSDRDAAGRAVLPGAVKRTVLRKRSDPKALCASFFWRLGR